MIEPRAKVVGTGNLTVFYVSTPIGTELTTVADVLSALRQPSEAMLMDGLEALGWIVVPSANVVESGVVVEQGLSQEDADAFHSEMRRELSECFLAMLDQFERDQGSAT